MSFLSIEQQAPRLFLSLTAIPRYARAYEVRRNAPGYAHASPCPIALVRLLVGN